MTLSEKIIAARKKQCITQEELAELTKITVRTIQRIESGKNIPRPFTLKVIAQALNISLEELINTDDTDESMPNTSEDDKYFVVTLCLSCFSYLILPYIHFLIPYYLLKRKKNVRQSIINFSQKVIQSQIYWLVCMLSAFMLALLFNLLQANFFNTRWHISYIGLFFIAYGVNFVLILTYLKKARDLAKTL
jgi:transcriptional regulator with XRE-family HTH domain